MASRALPAAEPPKAERKPPSSLRPTWRWKFRPATAAKLRFPKRWGSSCSTGVSRRRSSCLCPHTHPRARSHSPHTMKTRSLCPRAVPAPGRRAAVRWQLARAVAGRSEPPQHAPSRASPDPSNPPGKGGPPCHAALHAPGEEQLYSALGLPAALLAPRAGRALGKPSLSHLCPRSHFTFSCGGGCPPSPVTPVEVMPGSSTGPSSPRQRVSLACQG